MAKSGQESRTSDNLWLRWALGAFAISLLLKLGYFIWFSESDNADMIVRFGYLLVLLIAIYFSITENPNDQFQTLELIKYGMKSAAFYAILLAVFTYFYYFKIDSDYFELKVEKVLEAARLSNNADTLKIEQNARMIFSPFTHSTLTLVGTMIIGLIYSIVIATLHKRFNLKFS